jgi:hypothetical protein
MSETTTVQPTTPTEGSTSTEAATPSLLTSTEAVATTTPATGATTTEAAKPTTEATTTTEVAAPVVPEKYEFKAPEGTEYDSAVVDSYSAAAKEAGLTQEAAQKVIEKMAPALAERQATQIKAVQEGWLEATKTDSEFGGAKLSENMAIAKKALDQFDPLPAAVEGQKATTPLRTFLDQTGIGNNPDLIRFMYRAGKAISQDGFVAGSASTDTPRHIKDILYNNTGDK